MRKLLTIMLALVMSVSVATLFTACEEEQVHTFATEWTSDETHHWHKATCEHAEEISDKAEHEFGADGKCTVCQIEKPVVSTATTEQWSGEIESMLSMTNAKIVANVTVGQSVQKVEMKIDDNKISMESYRGDSFDGAQILVTTGENTYDFYFKTTENGNYTKLVPSNMQVEVFTVTINGFVAFAQAAKDKFANATFDETTKTYNIQIDSVESDGQTYEDLNYTFKFEDGKLVETNLKLVLAAQGLNYDIDFEFGGVEITIPSESIDGDSAYKVTSEQWTAKINALSNMTNARIVGVSTGEIKSSTIIEIDGNKKYYSVYENDVFLEAAVIVKVNESVYDVYKQTTENGQYTKLQNNADIEETLDVFDVFAYQYISANNFAKDEFDGAVYNGSTKDYTLAMESAELPDFITVSNLEYIVSFENAEIKDLSIEYGAVLNQTVNYSFDFEFGGVSITVPQV